VKDKHEYISLNVVLKDRQTCAFTCHFERTDKHDYPSLLFLLQELDKHNFLPLLVFFTGTNIITSLYLFLFLTGTNIMTSLYLFYRNRQT
jgi:hypothetical protein